MFEKPPLPPPDMASMPSGGGTLSYPRLPCLPKKALEKAYFIGALATLTACSIRT